MPTTEIISNHTREHPMTSQLCPTKISNRRTTARRRREESLWERWHRLLNFESLFESGSTEPLSEREAEEDDIFTTTSCLMEKRLLNHSSVTLSDFKFVNDCDACKNVDFYSNETTAIKTGVWEIRLRTGTAIQTESSSASSQYSTQYVVTGVQMTDRVDINKLHQAIFRGQKFTKKQRPRISMATKDIAEQLTGYASGTMAPICHTIPMKLFLEELIIRNAQEVNIKGNASHRLLMGSGVPDTILSIPVDMFLDVAKSNPLGFELVNLIKA